jgi:beta-glucanase (GH16 family)
MEFCNYSWRQQPPWGEAHPNDTKQWFDPECSYMVNGHLYLDTVDKSRIIDSKVYNYGVGLVWSIESFLYGEFIADIKFNSMRGAWPAFWLSGENDWPPEIDIFEYGMGKYKTGKFHNFPFMFRSAIHGGADGVTTHTENKHVWVKNPWKFNEYKLKWYKGGCDIYVNSKHVVHFDLDETFDQPMNVVFNNSLNLVGTVPQHSPMVVKNFTHVGI